VLRLGHGVASGVGGSTTLSVTDKVPGGGAMISSMRSWYLKSEPIREKADKVSKVADGRNASHRTR